MRDRGVPGVVTVNESPVVESERTAPRRGAKFCASVARRSRRPAMAFGSWTVKSRPSSASGFVIDP